MSESTKVWAIPLADNGFVPTGDNNPVRWYLERLNNGKVNYNLSFETKADAEAFARKFGWIVQE